ncbi:hypothetical protein D3C84_838640 [compost metagenome]
MLGGFKALLWIGHQRLGEVVFEPFRQVWAITCGAARLGEARALESLDFAIGVVAGEQVEQCHANAVQVLLGAGRRAFEGFGGNERWRAWQLMGAVFGEPRAEGQAEIQQAQFTVIAQVQVLRLDVPMEDIAPVQQAHRLQQLLGQ